MGGRELIYGADEVSAAMPVRPRKVPRIIPSVLPENPKGNLGTLVVQDVYINRHVNEKNPIAKGSIKSMRVNLIFTQPARGHWSRGDVSNEVIKRPLGTAPVNPDGSVAFSAPAGVPLQLQALDENGMAVMTMRSFIYLQPGETQTCVGCHENRASSPPNIIKTRVKVNPLKPTPGVDYDDMAFSFTRTVQPVLDRYCIGCHGLGGRNEKGKTTSRSYVFSVVLDESRGTKQFDARPTSYRSLVGAARTRLAHRNGETFISVPRDYFSHTSKLPKMLLAGHNGVKLDRDSFERIVTWLDLNSQCYGTYLPNRIEQKTPSTSGQAALRAYVKELFGAKLASQPLGALVNPANVKESRILLGPLAASRGGWGTIKNGYESTRDKRYAKMLKLAQGAYEPLEFINIDGTCGRPKCLCGNCWIREMVDAGTYKKQLKAKLPAGK
jgi:mono/diheme cytochrome c family protein